jgi:hypothetical protein
MESKSAGYMRVHPASRSILSLDFKRCILCNPAPHAAWLHNTVCSLYDRPIKEQKQDPHIPNI